MTSQRVIACSLYVAAIAAAVGAAAAIDQPMAIVVLCFAVTGVCAFAAGRVAGAVIAALPVVLGCVFAVLLLSRPPDFTRSLGIAYLEIAVVINVACALLGALARTVRAKRTQPFAGAEPPAST